MLSLTTTDRQQQVDLRDVHKAEDKAVGITVGDYAILALLGSNDRDPISHLTRVQKLMYIAQVGGLHNHPLEPGEGSYDATPVYFPFREEVHGPFSDELQARLAVLEEAGLVNTTEYPSQSKRGTGRTEYRLSDTAYDQLDSAAEVLTVDQIRTLKYVKTIYSDVPILELIDYTSGDYEFRDLNGQWA